MNLEFDPSTVNIDDILDNENSQNKTESWNKLNKTLKIQKLHYFSEKYGKDHKYSAKEIKQLKMFFSDALEKKKQVFLQDKNLVSWSARTFHSCNARILKSPNPGFAHLVGLKMVFGPQIDIYKDPVVKILTNMITL